MTIPGFVNRLLSQTLVYWANPVKNGYGDYTFDDPVEISGRCEIVSELIINDAGVEVMAKALVYLDQVVQEGEYMYLGTLADSVMDSAPIPQTTDGSMRVQAFYKTPALGSSTTFLYKAYLNKPYSNR